MCAHNEVIIMLEKIIIFLLNVPIKYFLYTSTDYRVFREDSILAIYFETTNITVIF